MPLSATDFPSALDQWINACEHGVKLTTTYPEAADADPDGASEVDKKFIEVHDSDLIRALCAPAAESRRLLLRLRDDLARDRNEWAECWADDHQQELQDAQEPDEDFMGRDPEGR